MYYKVNVLVYGDLNIAEEMKLEGHET